MRSLFCWLIIVSLFFVSCSKPPEQRARAFVEAGKKLFEQKNYAAARLEFLNAAQQMPDDPEPLYHLGLVSLVQANYGQAIGYLQLALKKNPQYVPARVKLAEVMAVSPVQAHVAEAEQMAETAVRDAPSDSEAVRVLAQAELKLGEFAKAEEHFSKSVETMPQNLKASIGLAVVKWQANDLNGAETVLKQAVASSPKAAEPSIVLGRFYRMLKRLPEAEGAFRRAVDVDPSNGLALSELAQFFVQSGREPEAEATYRRLSGLPERRYKPLHAIYLFSRGRQNEATTELKALAESDGSDREARSRLVAAYVMTNRLREAEEVLSAALKKNARDVSALIERARLNLSQGKVADTERDMLNVLQLNPDSAEAHYLLARALRRQGRRSFRQELTEAVRLDPRMLPARIELSSALREANEPRAALSVIEQAPTDQRQSLALVVERNWIWFALGEQAQIRKTLDGELRRSRFPNLLLQDALLKLEQKNYPGAIAAAEEVLKSNPRDLRAIDTIAAGWIAQKQLGAAVQRVRQCADAQPESAQLRYYLATWMLKTGRNEEARLALGQAIQLDGSFAPARLSLAQLELADKRYDNARQQVKVLLDKNIGVETALLLLGVIEESARNFPGAIDAYRKVLNVNGTNALAMNNLAYLLAEHTDDLNSALKYAQQVKQLSPESADVDDTLGWIYFRKGLYDAAIRHLEMSDKRRPAAVTRYHLAMAYEGKGERLRATEALMAARKMNPSLPEAAVAAKMIAGEDK